MPSVRHYLLIVDMALGHTLRIATIPLALTIAFSSCASSPSPIEMNADGTAAFRNGPTRPGRVTGAVADRPNVVWRLEGESPVIGSPVTADGIVFLADGDGVFHAIEATTGRDVWSAATGPTESSALVLGSHVLTIDNDGTARALGVDDGATLWTVELGGSVRSSALLADGKVIATAGESVVAIEADGSERWRSPIQDTADSSPAVDAGVVVVGDRSNGITALDLTDGQQLWQRNFDPPNDEFRIYANGVAASPAIVDGSVLVGSTNGTMYRLSLISGEVEWSAEVNGPVYASVALGDGVVYGATATGDVFSLTLQDGSESWRTSIGAASYSSPLFVDGPSPVLIVTEEGGNLIGLDPADGSERWRLLVGEDGNYMASSPTIVEGTIVLGVNTGEIVGIRG